MSRSPMILGERLYRVAEDGVFYYEMRSETTQIIHVLGVY